MRYFFLFLLLAMIGVIAGAGFRGTKFTKPPTQIFPDMDFQVKYKPQKTSEFFADGRVERPPIQETVPVGYNKPTKSNGAEASTAGMHGGFTQGTDYLNTGKMGADWGTGIPLQVDTALIERGQQRFNINCAVCHGATGVGNGITTKYGLQNVPHFKDERILKMADGEIFNTITHGKNTMMPYGDKVTVQDRWAIISYVRALQRAVTGSAADVPAEELAKLGGK